MRWPRPSAAHPEAAAAFSELGHEIACHGLRWISYQQVDEATERAHMARGGRDAARIFGSRAARLVHRAATARRRAACVVEHGGFLYDSDSYADDLPYWTEVRSGEPSAPRRVAHLVVPYTLDTNDMRFATAQGFNSGTQFFDYLRAAFDTLYREGDPTGARMRRRCCRSACIAA